MQLLKHMHFDEYGRNFLLKDDHTMLAWLLIFKILEGSWRDGKMATLTRIQFQNRTQTWVTTQ